MEPEYFCLCMSPALDASVTLSAWPSDGVIFKDVAETENVGGKGINVARWLPPAVPKDFYAAATRALKAEDYLLAHAPKVEIGEPKETVHERRIVLG